MVVPRMGLWATAQQKVVGKFSRTFFYRAALRMPFLACPYLIRGQYRILQSRFPACRSSEQAGFSARSKTGKNLCTLVAILGVFLFAKNCVLLFAVCISKGVNILRKILRKIQYQGVNICRNGSGRILCQTRV